MSDSDPDCCTEDEVNDWGYEELLQPSSLWGVQYKGKIQLDAAGVEPIYTSSR
jgi:hypothetical protein